MTIFEYRQTLDLDKLTKSATIPINVHRNQELYMKYQAFRVQGMIKTEAIRQVRTMKYFRVLTERTIYLIIKELETEV
jgi:hypothetical protein